MKEDNSSNLLFTKLSENQKQDLLLAYDESFDPENLIDHEEVKQHLKKWLSPLSE
ncbi:hypothetical protein ACFGVR_21650 [Mucilaginibacter sp. AW1-3]